MAHDQVQRGEPIGVSVIVCGAGVGGLMSALECWRRGCDVRIFERAPHNITTGDSFMIGPTAINGFRNWPFMSERNEKIAYHPLFAYHKITGERLSEPMDFGGSMARNAAVDKISAQHYRHARPKFHAMLLEQLAMIGIHVEYGKESVDYSEDEARGLARVKFTDGSHHEADLIIAADGIRGTSWKLVLGTHVPARSAGDAIFRVAYPVEYALADPIIAERFPLTDDGNSIIEHWVGTGVQCVFWRNEDTMSLGLQHPDHGIAEESWSHRVSPQDLLNFTSTIPGWPEVANRVIRAIPSGELMDFKLMWRDPQPRWTSPGGRVVQVGDAAHTLLPTSGQGGTQALEDAISLATCISLAGGRQSIPNATRVHNLLRFERVSCLQAFGILNKKKHTTEHENKQKTRVHIPKWVTNHDPELYAVEKFDEALAHLTSGTEFQSTNTPPGLVYRPWSIDNLLDAYEKGEPTVLDGDWS